ncbi:MAG: SMP-30/gluconolactonase/LRE family protein [Hydrogenophaga sp.]|uniref:SMP-30/gluconolactonase/LRE family protein n=1 Tax=Hydrogenophaga sp. TaxID=1904254 RepID=UPI0025C112BA|nr:SMP-30/gluconolactonase/LRE family protein [Hydrogenophaga sp.]MBT9550859.1 SMP-30/gluconolactonase/LRE family protein [Hydrogenophaga sp.]
MSTPQAELLLDARNGVGESPVWDSVRQSLWWVDIPGRALWCWHSASGQARHWPTPEQTGCIALAAGSDALPHGQWIAAMETGIARLTPQADGTVDCAWITRIEQPEPGMRFNDGRCDRQGRLLAGTMVMDMSLARASGTLYALDGAELRALQGGFITPNGMAFSPDGKTMYLSDSHPNVQTVWAYDHDTDTGTPHNRRVLIDFKPLPGRPDGAAVDADGCYWICGNDAGLVHRFTPDGTLDRSLAVPVKKPAMCAFGGAGLDILFVTSIRPGGDLTDQPLAGGVFALRPGVRGLDEPRCVA